MSPRNIGKKFVGNIGKKFVGQIVVSVFLVFIFSFFVSEVPAVSSDSLLDAYKNYISQGSTLAVPAPVPAVEKISPPQTTQASTHTLFTSADSTLKKPHPNASDGGAKVMLVKTGGGINRAIVGFTVPSMPGVLVKASLVLTIYELAQTWGEGRWVAAYFVLRPWIEGNGRFNKFLDQPSMKGTGQGVTWYCAVDTNISNDSRDCLNSWNGGEFDPVATDRVFHTNATLGEIVWDVTVDIAPMLASGGEVGWVVKKETEGIAGGKVFYYSREGGAYFGSPGLGPRLILEFVP